MAMYETITVEIADKVATITFNRPESMNALSYRMSEELGEVLSQFHNDVDVRAVILWGSETLFGVGADIVEKENRPTTVFEAHAYSRRLHGLCGKFETLPKPVIAAIGGYALGGSLELALSCDIRIASENARIGLPEVVLGTIPGAGGTQRLPRLVGSSIAKELLFTGDKISGQRALEIGLVNRIVPEGKLFQTAVEFASRLAKKAPLSMAMSKTAVNIGGQLALEDGLQYESKCFSMLTTTEDKREGAAAFREKRKPIFTGR